MLQDYILNREGLEILTKEFRQQSDITQNYKFRKILQMFINHGLCAVTQLVYV